MYLLDHTISILELRKHANCMSPEGESLVKAVVDVSQEKIVLGGSMHVDEEAFLLDQGSLQKDLWGINLYPDLFGTDRFIEYDSMINLRPGEGNKSRAVENRVVQEKIRSIISAYVREK